MAGKGMPKPKRMPMGPMTARAKMWRSMRALSRIQGGFSLAELQATANASYGSAHKYVYALVNAGYVQRTTRRGGKRARAMSWILVRDTGPHAPRVMRDRKTIFDPNSAGGNQ